jgi:hypothetical protein
MSDIEPEYKRLSGIVNDYNRAMWTTFADFWQLVLLEGEPRRTSPVQPPDEFILLSRETRTIEELNEIEDRNEVDEINYDQDEQN